MCKSVIHFEDIVDNKNPHHLARDSYYLVKVVDTTGVAVPALFTYNDIDRAIKRAEKNPEDSKGFNDTNSWVRNLLKRLWGK